MTASVGERKSLFTTLCARSTYLPSPSSVNSLTTGLLAAHKNPDADRTLLARLATGGLDVTNADPLFPDLDRLEELLREAQQGSDE